MQLVDDSRTKQFNTCVN